VRRGTGPLPPMALQSSLYRSGSETQVGRHRRFSPTSICPWGRVERRRRQGGDGYEVRAAVGHCAASCRSPTAHGASIIAIQECVEKRILKLRPGFSVLRPHRGSFRVLFFGTMIKLTKDQMQWSQRESNRSGSKTIQAPRRAFKTISVTSRYLEAAKIASGGPQGLRRASRHLCAPQMASEGPQTLPGIPDDFAKPSCPHESSWVLP